jgi:RNA polymerase sigma-70 factor (ECF subfamily)
VNELQFVNSSNSMARSPAVLSQACNTVDLQLLQRIVARDASAVGELYDRHSRLLFGVAMRILRSHADAEEVLQEVFVRVWTRADTYDERLGVPAAWLTRMARNRAIDRLRSRRSRGEVDPGVSGETQPNDLEANRPAAAPSPEALAQDAETGGALRRALVTLPPEQRMLIEAAFFEGYTHQELADRFSLPLGTVKTRIRTGIIAMRDRLEHAV